MSSASPLPSPLPPPSSFSPPPSHPPRRYVEPPLISGPGSDSSSSCSARYRIRDIVPASTSLRTPPLPLIASLEERRRGTAAAKRRGTENGILAVATAAAAAVVDVIVVVVRDNLLTEGGAVVGAGISTELTAELLYGAKAGREVEFGLGFSLGFELFDFEWLSLDDLLFLEVLLPLSLFLFSAPPPPVVVATVSAVDSMT